nr:hypothetical protein [uncultured Porphyromonas sp.]
MNALSILIGVFLCLLLIVIITQLVVIWSLYRELCSRSDGTVRILKVIVKQMHQTIGNSVKHKCSNDGRSKGREPSNSKGRSLDDAKKNRCSNPVKSNSNSYRNKEKSLSAPRSSDPLPISPASRNEGGGNELVSSVHEPATNTGVSTINMSATPSKNPETYIYTYLSVEEGRFVESTLGKTSYYRYRVINDRLFFEFFCEDSRVSKAINNHSAIIDPFCIRTDDSKPYNEAKFIETREKGELDSNLDIMSKPLVHFY